VLADTEISRSYWQLQLSFWWPQWMPRPRRLQLFLHISHQRGATFPLCALSSAPVLHSMAHTAHRLFVAACTSTAMDGACLLIVVDRLLCGPLFGGFQEKEKKLTARPGSVPRVVKEAPPPKGGPRHVKAPPKVVVVVMWSCALL
jgi:hypothetical protein